MPTEIWIRTIVVLLTFQAPLVAIASVGLWVAVSRRTYLARVSTWAVWGFGLLIAYSLASVTISVLTLQARTDVRAESASVLAENLTRLNLWGVAAYPLSIVGVALIARAVFLDRK